MAVDVDTEQTKHKVKAPPISELGKWFSHHLMNDLPTLSKAPLGTLAVIFFALSLCWFLVWKAIVPVKDATIQSKEATIQQLQTALAVNGLNTIPLKKRTGILAEQLDKFATTYQPNDPENWVTFQSLFHERFVQRVNTVIFECDQQGAHLDTLDSTSPFWQKLREVYLKPEAVRELANALRTLAGQLKD